MESSGVLRHPSHPRLTLRSYPLHSPDFNGVDGILGFGLPKAGQEGRELPHPILFAMTDQENKHSNARDLTRKFSFFSTDTDGTRHSPRPLPIYCKPTPRCMAL